MDKRELLSSMWEKVADIRAGMTKMEENIYLISDCIDSKKFISPEATESVMENLEKIEQASTFCKSNYEELSGESFDFDKLDNLEDSLKSIDVILSNQEEIETARRFLKLSCSDDIAAPVLMEAENKLEGIIDGDDSLTMAKNDAKLDACKPYARFMRAFDEKRMVQVLDYINDLRASFDDEIVAALLDKTITEAKAEAEPTVEIPAEAEAEPTVEIPAEAEAEPAVEIPTEAEAEPAVEIPVEAEAEPAVEIPVEAEPAVEIPVEAEAEPAVEIPVDAEVEPTVEIPVETVAEEPVAEPVDSFWAEPEVAEPAMEIPADTEEAEPAIDLPTDIEEAEPAIDLPMDIEEAEPAIDLPMDIEEAEPAIDLPIDVEEAEPSIAVPIDAEEPAEPAIAAPVADFDDLDLKTLEEEEKPIEIKAPENNGGGFFRRWLS